MPYLLSPGWLVLLPALVAVGWAWGHLGLFRPLRIVGIICAVFALADPVAGWLRSGMDLWVVIDHSDSCAAAVVAGEDEWLELLSSSKPSKDDQLRVVYFADGVSRPNPDEGEALGGGTSMSRLRTALQSVFAQVSQRRPSRVLTITDGFATESLEGVATKAQAARVPIDLRLIPPPVGEDLRIASFVVPSRTLVGEPFILDVEVAGRASGPARVVVLRDGQQLASRELPASEAGVSRRLQFADRVVKAGACRYETRVVLAGDTTPGNDVRVRWVEVTGGARILLVTRYPEDPLARFLRAQGFDVEQVSDPQSLHLGSLTSCRVVVFHNVGAFDVSRSFLEGLDFFVREQGGGLVMFGGENSFGSGGYFESPIDGLLPVSMELKADHRKLAVAMAIVMDRSGSMGATVAGGMTKMQLANEGAARAVELLGHNDVIAVYAVDSKAHEMVPPLHIGENREEILERVRRIQSSGGGIFMYEGLSAAVKALEDIEVGQRHIILFSDAADTEQPGGYKALLKQFGKDGGTVSVIGLGTPGDSDAKLLQDTAKRGGGRMFFTTDAGTLPNIFAQETVTVARSTFIDEPVGIQPTGSWIEISGAGHRWLERVDGYNLSYLREGATAHLLSRDEYQAPLVSTMRRGLGRTAAVAFPGGGDYSGSVRAWSHYGDFVQTLTRWLVGEEVPAGLALRTTTEGTDLVVDLHFSPDAWQDVIGGTPPPIALAFGEERGELAKLRWERLAPGRLRATRPLDPGVITRGAVQLRKATLPFGPMVVGGDVEWDVDPSKPQQLLATARASGGRELIDLGRAWKRPSEHAGGRRLQNLLALGMLLSILGDALLSRIGSLSRRNRTREQPAVGGRLFRKWSRKKQLSTPSSERARGKDVASLAPASPGIEVERVPSSEEQTRKADQGNIFRRAKSRRR